MRKRWTFAPAVVIVLAACTPKADGPRIDYRLVGEGDADAPAADVGTAVRVLEKRFDAAGYDGVEVLATPEHRISVTLPKELAPQQAAVCKLAERRGTLEFRIQAEAFEERKQRELRDASGGTIRPPPELMWVPRGEGLPDMLVCTPERPFLSELRKLDAKKVAHDAPAYVAAQHAYDDAVSADVFCGYDLAEAKVQEMTTKSVVYFAMKADRKSEFGRFTERHVRENMAIIVDGRVESAPVIRSKLPGAGIIEGGGPAGFTDAEAHSMAAVLAAGSMPGRLVRVPAPETK